MRREKVAAEICAWIAICLLLAPYAWGGTIEGRVSRGRSTADLSNFVIYVADIESPLPAKAPAVVKEMDQKNLQFVPHVLAIQAGTVVAFLNSDPVLHNVFSISPANRFNLGLYGRGIKRTIRFNRPGIVHLLCSVHMEMSGYIVVIKNPYFAQTTADGRFRIPDIPAGHHRVRCWHEKLPVEEKEIDVPPHGEVNLNFDMTPKHSQNFSETRETQRR